MLYLAVETSQINGSLCLIKDNTLVDVRRWSRQGSHSEHLLSQTESLLNEQNLQFSDLETVAVSVGPGSFTGVRIAVNFAKTFGYITNKALFTVSSLQLLATQALQFSDLENKNFIVLQYGFRDIIYWARYNVVNGFLVETHPPQASTVDALTHSIVEPCIGLGTALDILPPDALLNKTPLVLDPRLSNSVDASFFLNLSPLNKGAGMFLTWTRLLPLYIRASEAEEKLRGRT